ncbi:MAG: DegV family protein, partial [Anaerolineae bacterium]|nr:DegV family protein [Anaerolineae bacterium]
ITVIDSRTTSLALGMVAEAAARMALTGASRERIVSYVEKLFPLTHIFFVVDTLEYLQRGGRIGGAQALVGTLLNIKPLLAVQNGRVEALERVRTRRKALDRMVAVAVQYAGKMECAYRVGVLHSRSESEADAVAQRVCEQIDCVGLRKGLIGPVLGTHVGPGLVGVVLMPVLPES